MAGPLDVFGQTISKKKNRRKRSRITFYLQIEKIDKSDLSRLHEIENSNAEQRSKGFIKIESLPHKFVVFFSQNRNNGGLFD